MDTVSERNKNTKMILSTVGSEKQIGTSPTNNEKGRRALADSRKISPNIQPHFYAPRIIGPCIADTRVRNLGRIIFHPLSP